MFERTGIFGMQVHVSAFQMLISAKHKPGASSHTHSQVSNLNDHIEGTRLPAESTTLPAFFKLMQAKFAPT